MKKLDANLSISRLFGGGTKDVVRIEIEDKLSSTIIVQLRMSLEEFASALFGTSGVSVKAEWYTDRLGLKREWKREFVKKGDLHKFNVDGWRGRAEDLKNFHRRQQDGSFEVLFERWVEVDETGNSSES